MKKHCRSILVISLILLCLILSSCSSDGISKLNAYQLVKSAVEKTSQLESYEMEQKVSSTTELLGEEMETILAFDLKVADAAGKTPRAIGTMSLTLMGEEIKIDAYYENDVIYMSVEDEKVRIDASDEEAQTYQFLDTQKGILQIVPEDVLKDTKVTDNEDKSRTVELEPDEEKFSEIYNELISRMSNEEAYAEMMEDLKTTISIHDAHISITVLPSGYIGEYNISFTMDLQMSSKAEDFEYSINMDVDASIVYKDPGAKVTVTAPADLDTYKDYSEL